MAGFEIGGDAPGDRRRRQRRARSSTPPQSPASRRRSTATIDAAWAAAEPLAFATDWAGRATKTTTRVRALWSPTRPVPAVGARRRRARSPTVSAPDRRRARRPLRGGLRRAVPRARPGETAERYFEIELGPFGHFFDILVDRADEAERPTPRGRRTCASAPRATKRTSAPSSRSRSTRPTSLARARRAGAALPLGLYRMEGQAPRQYLAAFPTRTPKPNFHVPEAFGTLVLDP